MDTLLILKGHLLNFIGLGNEAMANVFGGLHVHDGVTPQSGIDTTPVILGNWVENYPSAGVTPAFAESKITIDEAGTYMVFGQFAFSGTANTTFQVHAAKNGVELMEIATRRKLGGGGDVGSSSFLGIVVFAAEDVLTTLVESDAGGGASLTLVDAQIFVLKLE